MATQAIEQRVVMYTRTASTKIFSDENIFWTSES